MINEKGPGEARPALLFLRDSLPLGSGQLGFRLEVFVIIVRDSTKQTGGQQRKSGWNGQLRIESRQLVEQLSRRPSGGPVMQKDRVNHATPPTGSRHPRGALPVSA